MKATLPYLRERFEHFNHLCFGGMLTMPVFQLTTAKSYIGQVRFHNRRRPDGTWEKYDFSLNFSRRFDLPEEDLDDIIIHEMIHYFIDTQNLHDTSTHGRLFRKMMNEINSRYQRHISVSYPNREIFDTDTLQRPAVICVSHLDNGTGITVCSSSRILHIARNLPLRYHLLSTSWYYTTDPYFNRFPHSREPIIYHIEESDLQHHLINAIPLQFDGHKFTRKHKPAGE